MALYLGSEKVKVISDNIRYIINLYSSTPIATINALLSSDNYVLKDLNDLYLIPKEDE